MGSLGNYLRELRVAKGASLDDMARATRVGRRQLEALETEQFHELPAPVFVKGFIRAYCEFLDTSPEEAFAHYREILGESRAAAGSAPAGRARSSWSPGPIVVSVALLVVLGGALFAFNVGVRGTGTSRQPVPRPIAGPSPSTVAAPRSDSTGTPPAPPPLPSPGNPAPPTQGGQRLLVKALEPTWIRVQTDRGAIAEELLPAGAVREWQSGTRFVLTVGNAGGIEVELNGQRLPRLGNPGAVIRDLVLPPEQAVPKS